MKFNFIHIIFLLFLIAFQVAESFACQLSIPESYVPTFLNPPVSGHYQKCESEPCYCVDNVDPWISEFVTEFSQDDFGINIETKVLKESPIRKAAYEDAKLAEKKAEEDKVDDKAAALERVKAFEFKGTTIATLKAELKAFKDDLKKTLE
jgi:hypothetical protein